MTISSCTHGLWDDKNYRMAKLDLCMNCKEKRIAFDLSISGVGEFFTLTIPTFAEALRAYDLAKRWVTEELDCDIREVLADERDEFSRRFEKLYDILSELPNEPGNRFWFDGAEILCEKEHDADAVAYFIDALIGDSCTHTGYYAPEEDRRSGETDAHTGYYYVDWD